MRVRFEALEGRPKRRYLAAVRAACTRRGIEAPAWAARIRPPSAPKEGKPSVPSSAEPVELAPGLVAWRRTAAGRVVSRSFDGKVTLFEWRAGTQFYARFPSEAAAVDALQADAVDWTRKNRPKQGAWGRAVA